MPGLPVGTANWLPHYTIDITTMGEAAIWWLVFSLLGLLLGVIYLTLLARRLPIGSMAGSSGRAGGRGGAAALAAGHRAL